MKHGQIVQLRVRLGVALVAALTAPTLVAETAEPVTESMPAGDLDALSGEVEAAEHRFNQAARERNRQQFHDLLSTDSVFLAGELHSGRLAVMAIWQHLFDGKFDFRYEAEVSSVAVARSGELAWAVGEVTTSFQRPGVDTLETTEGHYLHVWKRGEEGDWLLTHAASLVVHPTLGAARDPRGGLMTAWPELADQIDAAIDLRWQPTVTQRATSGELAVTFGEYEATFTPLERNVAVPSPSGGPEGEPAVGAAISGKGHYLAVWQRDEQNRWQLAGEGLTPPGIYQTE